MAPYTNPDGLTLRYGTEKGEVEPIGEYRYDGPVRSVEIKFDYTQLPTVAENSVVISDKLSLPKGACVERVEIFSNIDWTSGGTLNVGWVDLDGTSNIDVDAFVVAATATELTDGGTNVAGWVGAAVNGAAFTTAKYITWEQDTAAASAGAGYIRIYYSVASQATPA